MRRLGTHLAICLLTAAASGLSACTTVSGMFRAKAKGTRSDVFREVSGDVPVREGFAELEIPAYLKTHTVGHYPPESRDSPHGKPGYPFLLNIDGQAAVWKTDGKGQKDPGYLPEGDRNPDGGVGVRYTMRRRVAWLREYTGCFSVFPRRESGGSSMRT